jgi:uncharacterized protein (TIGR02466 family)
MYKFNDQVEVHYPTTVMQRQHKGVKSLNKKLLDLVLDLENRYKDTDLNEVNSETITTKGGYQTPNKVNFLEINNKHIKSLADEIIYPAIKTYLEHHFKESASQVKPWAKGWSNILHKGDWQAPHAHPSHGTIASGCYYVKLPRGAKNPEGCIEFINPMLESWHHGFAYSRRIQPSEGLIALFPPWYQHYVHPFKQDDSRCIVAFDVLPNKPGLDFVF